MPPRSSGTNTRRSNHLSLRELCKSLRAPNSSQSIQQLALLKSVPCSQVDHLLKKIHHQAHRWLVAHTAEEPYEGVSMDYLLRCFNAVLETLVERPQSLEVLSLQSFKAGVRLVLRSMAREIDALPQVKVQACRCWCTLLICLAKLANESAESRAHRSLVKAVLKDIRTRSDHVNQFVWATDVSDTTMALTHQPSSTDLKLLKAKMLCLRGLLAQKDIFALDILDQRPDALERLIFPLQSCLTRLPNLWQADMDDIEQRLAYCVVSTRLLEQLCHVATKERPAWLISSLSRSGAMESVRTAWSCVAMSLVNRPQEQSSIKPKLYQILTAFLGMLTRLPATDDVGRALYRALTAYDAAGSWHWLLPQICAQWVYDAHRQQRNQPPPVEIDHADHARLVTQLCNLARRCMVSTRQDIHPENRQCLVIAAKKIAGPLLNTLLHITCASLTREMTATIASDSGSSDVLLLDDQVLDLVDSYGLLALTPTMLVRLQVPLTAILDAVQSCMTLVHAWPALMRKLAWATKTHLAVLDQLPDASSALQAPLQQSYEKMAICLMDDEHAIPILAAHARGLGKFIWEPTISLILHAFQSIKDDGTRVPSRVLSKANRALACLAKVCKSSRGCEQLVHESSLLGLVNVDLFPYVSTTTINDNNSGAIGSHEYPKAVWTCYTLYVRLLVSLIERTSIMRTTLRCDCPLFDLIMGFTQFALNAQSAMTRTNGQQTNLASFCWLVIACLQAVDAFRYDQDAITAWLAWKRDKMTLISVLVSIGVPSTIPPPACTPWNSMPFVKQVAYAIEMIAQLAGTDEGAQLLIDQQHLPRIAQWLVYTLDPSNSESLQKNNTISDVALQFAPNDPVDGTCSETSLTRTLDDTDDASYMDTTGDDDPDTILSILLGRTMTADQDGDAPLSEEDVSNDAARTSAASGLPTWFASFSTSLMQCLTKVLSSQANLKRLLAFDHLTAMYAPFIPYRFDSHVWSMAVRQSDESLAARVDDLCRLYSFYQHHDDGQFLHVRDNISVGLVYALFHQPVAQWQRVLHHQPFTANNGMELVLYAATPLGHLFRMVLLTEHEHVNNDTRQAQRIAGAQAMMFLSRSQQETWKSQWPVSHQERVCRCQSTLQSLQQVVNSPDQDRQIAIDTDDSTKSWNTRVGDLTWLSPAFDAMLLVSSYAESGAEHVRLHDVSMADLQFFVFASQKKSSKARRNRGKT
ncbi:hypothetical protein BC940DRAFT_321042 [Gongronella butleri]|nr:hypothetical protein BC940DRAFT_321042 [Gongronella butleri]